MIGVPPATPRGSALHQLHREIGPAVGEGAQLVDRHNAGMLELAADLGLLHEPAHQLGLVLVALEQDLHRQVAAQVGVASLEHGPHAAAGDLAEELVPVAALLRRGHLVGGGLDHGHPGVIGRRVGQQHAGDRADRSGEALQDMARMGRLEAEGDLIVVGVAQRCGGRTGPQPCAKQAGGAGAGGDIRGERLTTARATSVVGHRRCSGRDKVRVSTPKRRKFSDGSRENPRALRFTVPGWRAGAWISASISDGSATVRAISSRSRSR